jgi:hypothetical protein
LTTSPKWISFQYPAAALLASYEITARIGAPSDTWSPSTWDFQGSNTGSSWTTLDSQTGIAFAEGQSRTFPVSIVTKYEYFRLYVTIASKAELTVGSGAAEYVVIGQLVIFVSF